ncbi:MAG TPA: hypothetical protein VGQ83_12600 [Polyangia bacterium]
MCSLCCGRTREAAACAGCSWYQPPVRSYDPLPRFSTQEVADSEHLQRISFPVEAGLCSLDRARDFALSGVGLRLLEDGSEVAVGDL